MIKAKVTYVAKCPQCGEVMTSNGTFRTLVGYSSPPGHDHDDNCRKRFYKCKNGHEMIVSKRNFCWCGWVGKKTCFCCPDEKVDEWPDFK